MGPAAPRSTPVLLPSFTAVSADTVTDAPPAGAVPDYASTIRPFSEGDVVSGNVVRIDKDEVLVDIGYKSEGVIPSHELSIRKSVDPSDEVEMGEEVDALVLKKEDDEGRLILSKKRARFEKAWRRIEAAAESGEPVEGLVIEVVKGGLILDLGAGPEPGRVHGPEARVQGDRAEQEPKQRRPLPPCGPGGGA
jgi:DNA-directed RNA polymerase subunit E'/Rpb7